MDTVPEDLGNDGKKNHMLFMPGLGVGFLEGGDF